MFLLSLLLTTVNGNIDIDNPTIVLVKILQISGLNIHALTRLRVARM